MTVVRSKLRRWLISTITVVVSLCFLGIPSQAGEKPGSDLDKKISPVLKQEVDFLLENPRFDYRMPLIIQVQRDFFERQRSIGRAGGHRSDNMLSGVYAYTANLNATQIKHLLRSPLVSYVTLDAVLRPSDDFGDSDSDSDSDDEDSDSDSDSDSDDDDAASAESSSAVQHRKRHGRGSIGVDALVADGSFVAGASHGSVAIFDSGIAAHANMDPTDNRVIASADFTFSSDSSSPPLYNDEYGHGTHVAGIIGGNDEDADSDGVDPSAKFVNVKVIADDGTGSTSQLIQAIDWTIQNKDTYDIRVANLSLGHPPLESYKNDPLCQAVRNMVEAGIVTIVSAGNLGKTDQYPKIWGGITSPGTEPTVITVGAVNTQGTLTHADDIATSYSSRGYTVHDGLFKPDLVAPGNKITSLRLKGGKLDKAYPDLVQDPEYASLSGSSMATAFVSGVATLLMDANPDLNPNLVKAILVMTATKMTNVHPLEQGHGQWLHRLQTGREAGRRRSNR